MTGMPYACSAVFLLAQELATSSCYDARADLGLTSW